MTSHGSPHRPQHLHRACRWRRTAGPVAALARSLMWGALFVMMSATSLDAVEQTGIEVSGRGLSVNGTDTVHTGLFGVHASGLSPEAMRDWGVASLRVIHQHPTGMPLRAGAGSIPAGIDPIIECFYDRYQPARQLTDPDWRRNLADLARRYARAAAEQGGEHHVEFWNEPYLNWSVKPGVNYNAEHYVVEDAVEGGPVTIRGHAEPTEYLRWTRGLTARDAVTGERNDVFAGYMPRGLKPGDTYPIRGTTYRVEETWVAKDPTQDFYWAGKQNALWYRELFAVFAGAMKDENPAVQVAAGWGFNIFNEGWESWKRLYRPLIDESLELMDGIHEHHYGGDTRRVAASYEVVTAYTDERGKRLRFYNTEAGGMLDPQQPTTAAPHHSGTPLERARGAMTYLLRDVVHLLDACPDKAFARAAHQPEHNGGDEFAFKLLKPLRGRLIATSSGDPDHWCVASLDGASLAVVGFNDSRQDAEVPLRVHAPSGTTLTACTMLSVTTRADGEGLELITTQLPVDDPTLWTGSLTLATKSARTLVFQLGGEATELPQRMVSQHYAPGILARVTDEAPLLREVELPADELAAATGARLKLVVSGHDGAGVVSVNDQRLPLTGGNNIVRQTIDPALLQPHTSLRFSAEGKAYDILMASIELITDR